MPGACNLHHRPYERGVPDQAWVGALGGALKEFRAGMARGSRSKHGVCPRVVVAPTRLHIPEQWETDSFKINSEAGFSTASFLDQRLKAAPNYDRPNTEPESSRASLEEGLASRLCSALLKHWALTIHSELTYC